ncbi:unnamed protein product [Psylliodes chrysocephalus]|uniref:Heparan-alpha-glucosaminide N-acetyltransferase n=1 Tax=Psylliodes chrysocephalus TaxID=3402493 RepID=A0A9P0CYI7_9CUCU|nr:unnamed protein product [Psylliodes chrysocephala]
MPWCFIDDYDENNFKDYDLSDLVLDQFYLNINVENSSGHEDVYLYTLNKECYQCPYLLTSYCNGSIQKCNGDEAKNIFSTDLTFRLSTVHSEYFPADQKNNVICDINEPFGQFGIYNVNVNRSGCFVQTIKESVNIYSPILTVCLIYLGLFLFTYGLYFCWKKYNSKKLDKDDQVEPDVPKKERIQSLDTFRGFAIILMIFANYGQGGYTVIEHARWNGLHAADLVFPSFLWIMGACIPIGMVSNFKKQVSNKDMIINVAKRSIKLFCIGIFLNSGADLNYLRFMGVLQRLGIAYFAVSVICIFCMDRTNNGYEKESKLAHVIDILKLWKGWIIVLAILVFHTILTFTIAAPGCPKGYLGPGGLHKNASYFDCVGGATGYIDGLILGKHRYQNPTIFYVYEAKPFDPEGIVGCLTTIFHCFIGVQAGITLLTFKGHFERLTRWLLWAVITGIVGGALCGFTKEEGFIPVNKNLWSLSFVMATSCFAFFMLSVFYVLVDYKKWWTGKPLLFAGMNAILMYIGHEMCDNHFPVRWYVHNYSNFTEAPRRTHFLALLSDVWATEIWVLVSYYLYKIKYFFTV